MANDTRPDDLLTLGLVGLGLAHELNSPLTAAALSLELLADRLRGDRPPTPDEAADAVERTLVTVHRMATLVDRFRRFARGEGGRPTRVVLDDIADAVQALVRPALAEISTVTLHRGAREPAAAVVADTVLLEQAAAIAVLNAADALRATGGVVTLAVSLAEGAAVLDVDDDGPGFSAPERATEIGFSSKGSSGMGIGLPLARRIAEEIGGVLEVGNRRGGGARVRFRLPLSAIDDGPSGADPKDG